MEKQVYEIHRSEAITVLLEYLAHPQFLTNLEMAECLESYWKDKGRKYLVKEDNLELKEPMLTAKTF